MRNLTRAKAQIAQIFWQFEKGFNNDIIYKSPKIKSAYSGVSVILANNSEIFPQKTHKNTFLRANNHAQGQRRFSYISIT